MAFPGKGQHMNEHEHEEAEQGRFAVPGQESHETDESLSPDELGNEDRPVPPPSEPKQPAAKSPARPRGDEPGIWARIARRLRLRN
jgi:hypothetical protein